MNPTTFETTMLNGQIQLPVGIEIPENSRLVVTVVESTFSPRIRSPRLADPSQAGDFEMEVAELPDARL